jgi:hypothetical protein
MPPVLRHVLVAADFLTKKSSNLKIDLNDHRMFRHLGDWFNEILYTSVLVKCFVAGSSEELCAFVY